MGAMTLVGHGEGSLVVDGRLLVLAVITELICSAEVVGFSGSEEVANSVLVVICTVDVVSVDDTFAKNVIDGSIGLVVVVCASLVVTYAVGDWLTVVAVGCGRVVVDAGTYVDVIEGEDVWTDVDSSLAVSVMWFFVGFRVVGAFGVLEVSSVVDVGASAVSVVVPWDVDVHVEVWTAVVVEAASLIGIVLLMLEGVLAASVSAAVVVAKVSLTNSSDVVEKGSVVVAFRSVALVSSIVVDVKTPVVVFGSSVADVSGIVVVPSVPTDGVVVISGVVCELGDSVVVGSEKHCIVCT